MQYDMTSPAVAPHHIAKKVVSVLLKLRNYVNTEIYLAWSSLKNSGENDIQENTQESPKYVFKKFEP